MIAKNRLPPAAKLNRLPATTLKNGQEEAIMTMHVRKSMPARPIPALWTPWGSLPAPRGSRVENRDCDVKSEVGAARKEWLSRVMRRRN